MTQPLPPEYERADDDVRPVSAEPKKGASARQIVDRARVLTAGARHLRTAPNRLREQAQQQYAQLQQRVVREQLWNTPLERLRDATDKPLRIASLEQAGFHSVADILDSDEERLKRLDGIGTKTAENTVAAARKITDTVAGQAVFQFDPDRRDQRQTEFLRTMASLLHTDQLSSSSHRQTEDLITNLTDGITRAKRASSRLRFLLSSRRARDAALNALTELESELSSPAARTVQSGIDQLDHIAQKREKSELWRDYEHHAARYNTLLANLISSEGASSTRDAKGFIPDELEREADAIDLNTSLLRATLRGYQAFGARFALARKRTILGDEMGLGKTIEAIAAMSHLAADGRRHFFVVCPASVLVNWISEIGIHSRLAAISLHGPERALGLQRWLKHGGVAVTTFDTLQRLPLRQEIKPDLLVVDEAHYAKNPAAQRSVAVADLSGRSEAALFLTGTPMENRVEEFKNLVSYLQPKVAARVDVTDTLAGAKPFRKAVAPVYLRRNQEDVLKELPPLLEVEDWVEFTRDDHRAYRRALERRNFTAARYAAYDAGTPDTSAKLERMRDIIAESADNGWKVLVFSQFLYVLEAVYALTGDDIPMITGRVPPNHRQEIVDDFNRRDGHTVLLGQITAAGQGLNIQSASVVILAEPQLKPTAEDQAIARAHRMGQTRKVHVHRLLAKDTVDQRLREILHHKSSLIAEYARHSIAKNSSAAATDGSRVNYRLLTDEAVPLDHRLLEVERQRLGLD